MSKNRVVVVDENTLHVYMYKEPTIFAILDNNKEILDILATHTVRRRNTGNTIQGVAYIFENKKEIYLHRAIAAIYFPDKFPIDNTKKSTIVIFKDGNSMNCKKENLEVHSRSFNIKKMQQRDQPAKIKEVPGVMYKVYWADRWGKWHIKQFTFKRFCGSRELALRAAKNYIANDNILNKFIKD